MTTTQYAIARRPPDAQLWTIIFAGAVATFGGLLGDVVASYLVPALKDRWALAVGLFALLWIASTGFAVYKEYGTWLPLPAWTPSLDGTTRAELESILLPLMQEEEDRHALLRLALGNDRVYDQIDFTGAAEPFTVNMIDVLVQRGEIAPGKQALWALLEVAAVRVGVDQQDRIAALRPTVAALSRRSPASRLNRLPQAIMTAARNLKPLPLALFLVLAVLVALGGPLITGVIAQNVERCLPDRVCVLVVRFGPESKDASGLAGEIYARLDEILAATARAPAAATASTTGAPARADRYTLKIVPLAEDANDNRTHQQRVSELATRAAPRSSSGCAPMRIPPADLSPVSSSTWPI